jgi:hypothetical protein
VNEGSHRLFKSNEVLLSLRVAVIGFAGVLAGGLVSYLANQSLQQSQLDESKRLEDQAAKSAAVLEHFRLSYLRQDLADRAQSRLVADLSPVVIKTRLGTAELSIMLVHLRPGGRPRLHAGRGLREPGEPFDDGVRPRSTHRSPSLGRPGSGGVRRGGTLRAGRRRGVARASWEMNRAAATALLVPVSSA